MKLGRIGFELPAQEAAMFKWEMWADLKEGML